MKKILTFVLVFALLLALVGCGSQTENKPDAQIRPAENEPAIEPANEPANAPAENPGEEPEQTPEPEPEPETHPLCFEDIAGTWKFSTKEGAKTPLTAQLRFSGDGTLYCYGKTHGTTIEEIVPYEIKEDQVVFHAYNNDAVAVYDPAEDVISCSNVFFGLTLKLHREDSFVLSEEAKPLVGTWKTVTVIIGGNTYTAKEKNLELTLILKDSGIAAQFYDEAGHGTEYREWTFEDGVGKLIKNGEVVNEFTFDGEKLTMPGSVECILEKQN